MSYASELLQKAKAILVLDQPFFASMVLRRPITLTTAVPTACVDTKCNIFLNPEWVEKQKLTTQHMIFLLCHEAFHYMLLHGVRRGQRDPAAWNIACDAVINDTLTACKIGTFIEGGVEHPGARQLKAEDVYVEPPEGGNGPSGPGGPGDDILEGTLTDGELAEVEAQVRVDVAQAEQAAKMQGKMPAELQRIIDSIINVPTPWHSILERFMEAYRKDEYSWSRPNRRFIAQGIYLPGQNYVPEMGELVIGVDTSGSIGQNELDHFAGHVNRIIEQCRPTKVHVVYCDSRVAHVDEYGPEELPITLTAHGGGGTYMPAIFRWVDDQGITPDAVVILTDGYTQWDAEPAYNVAWLITTDIVAPYGLTVPYELN